MGCGASSKKVAEVHDSSTGAAEPPDSGASSTAAKARDGAGVAEPPLQPDLPLPSGGSVHDSVSPAHDSADVAEPAASQAGDVSSGEASAAAPAGAAQLAPLAAPASLVTAPASLVAPLQPDSPLAIGGSGHGGESPADAAAQASAPVTAVATAPLAAPTPRKILVEVEEAILTAEEPSKHGINLTDAEPLEIAAAQESQCITATAGDVAAAAPAPLPEPAPALSQEQVMNQSVEDLREKRDELNRQILQEQEDKAKIERELSILGLRLQQIDGTIARKTQARDEYDKTIQETEAAYAQTTQSLQTLSNVLTKKK